MANGCHLTTHLTTLHREAVLKLWRRSFDNCHLALCSWVSKPSAAECTQPQRKPLKLCTNFSISSRIAQEKKTKQSFISTYLRITESYRTQTCENDKLTIVIKQCLAVGALQSKSEQCWQKTHSFCIVHTCSKVTACLCKKNKSVLFHQLQLCLATLVPDGTRFRVAERHRGCGSWTPCACTTDAASLARWKDLNPASPGLLRRYSTHDCDQRQFATSVQHRNHFVDVLCWTKQKASFRGRTCYHLQLTCASFANHLKVRLHQNFSPNFWRLFFSGKQLQWNENKVLPIWFHVQGYHESNSNRNLGVKSVYNGCLEATITFFRAVRASATLHVRGASKIFATISLWRRSQASNSAVCVSVPGISKKHHNVQAHNLAKKIFIPEWQKPRKALTGGFTFKSSKSWAWATENNTHFLPWTQSEVRDGNAASALPAAQCRRVYCAWYDFGSRQSKDVIVLSVTILFRLLPSVHLKLIVMQLTVFRDIGIWTDTDAIPFGSCGQT